MRRMEICAIFKTYIFLLEAMGFFCWGGYLTISSNLTRMLEIDLCIFGVLYCINTFSWELKKLKKKERLNKINLFLNFPCGLLNSGIRNRFKA